MAFVYSNLHVSVGVCGALQFNENSDSMQTIKKILPEEKIDLEFPILVTSFETGSATVHLTFSSMSPGDPSIDADYSLDYDDYGKNYNTTVVVSDVYEFEVGEFLHPLEYLPAEFLGEWNRFPAGFVLYVNFEVDPKATLLEKIQKSAPSFHQVQAWSYSEQYFYLVYSSMSWFEDQLCFTLIGQQSQSGQIYTRFVFRASDPIVLSIFHLQVEKWLDLWAGAGWWSLSPPENRGIFCATPEKNTAKSDNDQFYTEEEKILEKWQNNRFVRPAPVIPVLNGSHRPSFSSLVAQQPDEFDTRESF